MKKYNTPAVVILNFMSSDCITSSAQGFSSVASGSGDIWDWSSFVDNGSGLV